MSKKLLVVFAALTILSFLRAPAAKADPQCFTLESIQGNYAVIGTYGANVALALGTRSYDGNGNFTGAFVVNEPTAGSTTGARTIVTGTNVGTYTVNCDGTGVVTRTITASTGLVTTQMDNFIITKARVQHSRDGKDRLIATAVVDAQQTPSAIVAGGIFLTRSYTRLPDAGDDPDSQK